MKLIDTIMIIRVYDRWARSPWPTEKGSPYHHNYHNAFGFFPYRNNMIDLFHYYHILKLGKYNYFHSNKFPIFIHPATIIFPSKFVFINGLDIRGLGYLKCTSN